MTVLLAIDVGLTNVKAGLFRPDGELVALSTVPYPTLRPTEDSAEQDPLVWSAAVSDSVLQLPAALRGEVLALGITGHMHALVSLDAERRPIGPALVLGDRRAAGDGLEITRRVGAAEILAATGAELDASMPAAKARFLRRRNREEWRSVRHLLGCKDFLRLQLTGDIATEPVDACATSLYDIRSGSWSEPLLEAAEVDPSWMPPVRSPWSKAGLLLPEAASRLGLRPGIDVAIGAGDDVVVLGLGLLDPGIALEHIGTTGSVMTVSDEPVLDPDRGLELYPHVIPGKWVIGGSLTTAGAALAWAASLLGYASIQDALDALRASGDEAIAFLPTLAGERFPARVPDARGAWGGLSLHFTRETLMRSAFVGVAESLRMILDQIDIVAGRQQAIRVAAADDERWLSLRAARYGRPLQVSASPEPTGLGLATLVAVAAGLYSDVRTAVDSMTSVTRSVESPPSLRTGPELERHLRPAWPVARDQRKGALAAIHK